MAIESVLSASANWNPAEIVLVDSASTDETVEIARKYSINILKLKQTTFLSAGAGRFIGMLYTHGDLIMYMDGDMTMSPGWLDQAIPYLMSHTELAGITGKRHDVFIESGQIIAEADVFTEESAVEVKHFGGAALYRRAALEKVGGFNPYLISEEEPELCMRLRRAGYKLVRIPYPVCTNYTLPIGSWRYFLHRFRTNLWLGHGQVVRYHLQTGMLWMVVRERGTFVFFLAIVLMAISSFLWALLAGRNAFIVWLATVGAAFLIYWVKKRSLWAVAMSIIHQCCVAYGGVRGFMISPQSVSAYPTDVETVQVQIPKSYAMKAVSED